jgi:hypothetical protein
MTSDSGRLSVTADGVTRYVAFRRKQEDAAAPLRGDSNLCLVADAAAAATLRPGVTATDTMMLEFAPVGRRRLPASICPAHKGCDGDKEVWFSVGSAVGAWPTRPDIKGTQQHDIRSWTRVAVEGGGWRLRMMLRPDRYLCVHGEWLCLGEEAAAATFSFLM